MQTVVKSVHFDETVFRIPPTARVTSKHVEYGLNPTPCLLAIWEQHNTNYTIEVPSRPQVTVKDSLQIADNDGVDLFISKKESGQDTVYTVRILDNASAPTIEISLTDILEAGSSPEYTNLVQMHHAMGKFLEKQLSPIIDSAMPKFFLDLVSGIHSADFQNYTQRQTGQTVILPQGPATFQHMH